MLALRTFALQVAVFLAGTGIHLAAASSAAASTPFSCPAGDDFLTTGGLWQNEDDATKFWQCDRELRAHLKQCPHGLEFNEGPRVCDWPPSPTFPGNRALARADVG